MVGRAAALAVAVLALLIGSRAAAAPFDLAGHDWEGLADFAELARSEAAGRVVLTAQLDMRGLKREDGVILLHPEHTLDSEGLARFMRAGGRVVLLDDFGTGDGLLQHFGLERVPAPRRPVEALRGNPQLAVAEPASAHPVAIEVARVVTNHPTGLRHPDLSPVLKIRAVGEPDVLVAVAGAVGQGRLLVVGDPSIVMNSMLRYPGNKSFARGLVKYAGDDDTWGKRGGKIYIATGGFEQKGSFGDDSLLGDAWNERLRAIEDALAAARRDGLSPAVAYFVAAAVGLAVVLWVGSRAGRTHRPAMPKFTRSVPLVAQGGIAGHAAVIGATHTSRVLAMLELKNALEEDLCVILGQDELPPHADLLTKLSARGLIDTEGLRTLKRVLLRLSSIETMVLSQRSSAVQPIRDREVLAVAKAVMNILAQARAALATRDEVAVLDGWRGPGADHAPLKPADLGGRDP